MLFVMVGCGSEPQAKEQKLSKLTIGLMPDTDSIPFIIAAEYGYFAEEGLEIELIPFKSAMERDAALQSGSLDGAVSDLLAVIFARSGGFPYMRHPTRTEAITSLRAKTRTLPQRQTCAARRSPSPATQSSNT